MTGPMARSALQFPLLFAGFAFTATRRMISAIALPLQPHPRRLRYRHSFRGSGHRLQAVIAHGVALLARMAYDA